MKKVTMTRSDILEQAKTCVSGDRDRDYGSPENSFEMIAKLWSIYLQLDPMTVIEPRDVAAMLALLKIARISSGVYKADNWIDLAGYAACGGEIESNLPTIDALPGNTEEDIGVKVRELLGKE